MLKLVSVVLMSALITGCNGSDSGDNEQRTELRDVADYSLRETASVLSEAETHLSGLSIDEFFEQSFLLVSNRNDENAISAGFTDQFEVETVSLGDISDAFLNQTYAVEAKILEMLKQYDRNALSPQQQLSYDIYHQHLTYQQTASKYVQFDFPATYGFFGWPGSTESFFTEVFVITNLKQAQIYLALLNQYKDVLARLKHY